MLCWSKQIWPRRLSLLFLWLLLRSCKAASSSKSGCKCHSLDSATEAAGDPSRFNSDFSDFILAEYQDPHMLFCNADIKGTFLNCRSIKLNDLYCWQAFLRSKGASKPTEIHLFVGQNHLLHTRHLSFTLDQNVSQRSRCRFLPAWCKAFIRQNMTRLEWLDVLFKMSSSPREWDSGMAAVIAQILSSRLTTDYSTPCRNSLAAHCRLPSCTGAREC